MPSPKEEICRNDFRLSLDMARMPPSVAVEGALPMRPSRDWNLASRPAISLSVIPMCALIHDTSSITAQGRHPEGR